MIKRDVKGNALGGIRLAEFAVHTSVSTGVNSGSQFCNLYGRYEPFADEEINRLYPTHKSYVDQVKAFTNENLAKGYIQAPEARRTIKNAEMSYIGSGDPCKAACRQAQDLQEATYYYLGLTRQADPMAAKVAAIVRMIAKADGPKGKPADRDAAKKAIESYVKQIQSLQNRGTITPLAGSELIRTAGLVTSALTTGTAVPLAPTLGG